MLKPVFFVDMDGVIALYDRFAYDRNNGPEPNIALFEYEPAHYFRSCRPDNDALNILQDLLSIKTAHVFIMTSVAPHIPWAVEDKKIWLRKHCPYIDIDKQVIIARQNKSEMALAKLNSLGIDNLNKLTYLIDDFNPNLFKWGEKGGTAVKYLNGINSPESWPGLYITGREQIQNKILLQERN